MRSSAACNRALVWFRRDLRDFDHAALSRALREAREVLCAFVFDREILDPLPSRSDRRVEFIRESLVALDASLRKRGGALIVRYAPARDAIPAIAAELRIDAVYANRDYEPQAIERDAAVEKALAERGIAFRTSKDQVIFERDEVRTRQGAPFAVFTPYKRAWLASLTPAHLAPHPVDLRAGALATPPRTFAKGVPTLGQVGFRSTNLRDLDVATGMSGGAARFASFKRRIERYGELRDYPARKGPSYLSVHLRFGTVSIRALVAYAHQRSLLPGGEGAATWLSELVWREFYAQLLWHHPRIAKHAFLGEYDGLPFPNDLRLYEAWRDGRTGYPIVDAAMRQINTTGYMHNRLRMVAASFLVKHLLVDWRWGERYFAEALIDYDLASNNGGWQWAASTGCDAQPYFRIFNPITQSQRFDPEGEFIRRYVPELESLDDREIHAPWQVAPAILEAKGLVIGRDYPPPIVDHGAARNAALALYKSARNARSAQR
jgi:deoxyribodipyrimidine photo-lyase